MDIETGSVCFIQRFGSGLNLNIHFHILISEGGYYLNKRKRAKFLKIRSLVEDDINQILHDAILSTERLIRRKLKVIKILDKKDIDLYADSIRNMISFGERAGEFVRKLKEEESFDMPSRYKKPLISKLVGLHFMQIEG